MSFNIDEQIKTAGNWMKYLKRRSRRPLSSEESVAKDSALSVARQALGLEAPPALSTVGIDRLARPKTPPRTIGLNDLLTMDADEVAALNLNDLLARSA